MSVHESRPARPGSRPESRLAARERRALVLGAVIIASLVLGTRGVPEWRRWRVESRATLMEFNAEVADARHAVALGPTMQDSLVARRQRLAAYDTLLLAGDDPTAAAAALADAIAEAAEVAEVEVSSVQTEVDSARMRRSSASELLRVRVRADLTASGSALADMLAWLEECPPLLAVRELTVSPVDVMVSAGRAERLRVTLVVEGVAWRGASALRALEDTAARARAAT